MYQDENIKKPSSRKKIIIVAAIILGLVLASAFLIGIRNHQRENQNTGGPTVGSADENKNDQSKESKSPLSSLPACRDGKELFTTFPVKDGEYTSIVPLGNLNPSGHTFPTDHIYVEVHDPQHPQDYTVTVAKALIAPADILIYGIQSSEQVGSVIDYGIDFSPCKDAKGKFGHVGSISEKLKTEIDKIDTKCNEYETGGKKYRGCDYSGLKIEVKAGEQIGTAGSERSGMLDIWMSDYREPQVKRANESRWNSERNYVSCFLDYYKTAQKDQFYGLLRGPNNGIRTKEPRCGTVEVDIASTAQGVWFYNLEGQVQQEDSHLALAFDNLETDKQVFSVGTAASDIGIPSGAYHFVPRAEGQVNRDFSQVTADDKVYCYETVNISNRGASKTMLLTMPSAEKLRIAPLSSSTCGAGPWQMTSSFVEYER